MSAAAHGAGIIALIVNLEWGHKLDAQVESVPVEMITSSDFNEIMNGEKTAKQMPTPQRRVDQVAALEDKKSAPPIPDSKKDTPPPPSPEKANADPGQDEKPTEEANAPPPPPQRPQPVTPPVPIPPVPMPPERPVETSEAPKAESAKPPPQEAEAIEPKPMPQPRPKDEVKKPPKKVAKQPPKKPARPVEEAKEVPDPPRKHTLDKVAKLLDSMKPPKQAVKQRSGNEAKDAKHSDFSLDTISALLDHDAPQRTASRGQKLTQLASLGSPTAHAERLSPSMMAQIDGWLIDHYRGCWSYFGLGAATGYVPKVHVMLARDGTLVGRPVLLNQPDDPNLRSLADSALRAVNKCNPMPIPEWFKAHYDAWRDRTVRFDPKEMS